MEEAGSISPVLINQLKVFKAQNAFKEKENRVTYLPFFPQRSNRGCSQGCSFFCIAKYHENEAL